jgi:thioester reductase-like protein
MQYSKKKLSITILILGDIKTGFSNKQDWFIKLLSTILLTNIAPKTFYNNLEILNEPNYITVDYCSKVIIEISKNKNCENNIFHIIQNKKSFNFLDTIINMLIKDLGFNIKLLEYKDWIMFLKNNKKNLPFLPFLNSFQFGINHSINYNNDNLKNIINYNSNLITSDILKLYLNFIMKNKLNI